MKLSKNLGMILLAVWLIVTGLVSLIGFSFTGLGPILAILAIAAGAVLIFNLGGKGFSRNLGFLLLGIWLILEGLIPLLSLSFGGLSLLRALLAVAAGALILLRR